MNSLKMIFKPLMGFIALLLTTFVVGISAASAAAPTVVSSSPSNSATNVPTSNNNNINVVTGTVVTATFSQAMDPTTINSSAFAPQFAFTLKDAAGYDVPGTVTMNATNTVASFTPSATALNLNAAYTATVSTAVRDAGGTAMAFPIAWSFVTKAVASTAQESVKLGAAGTFAILSQTGITDVYASAITGDVGTSPITGAALLLTCGEVTGKIYVVDAAGPLPCAVNDATTLTAAVGDMGTAYLDAAGRTSANYTELGAGEIGGLTLAPGLYKWGTDVSISTDVTLAGGPNDIWIFQVAGQLNQASAKRITLSGGALAKNVFWQVAGSVSIGTTAHFEGVVLGKTLIAVNTGASVNGRLFAQTAATLQMNVITQPAL